MDTNLALAHCIRFHTAWKNKGSSGPGSHQTEPGPGGTMGEINLMQTRHGWPRAIAGFEG
jgi:hypothetical protein